MAYVRENVNGTSPQDLNKLNENFMTIWQKVFGDIDFSDATNNLKEKICTQWIPVQGEGNFDKNNDIKIRFFVPPNTKKIKASSFNFIAEQYRMDSDVANGGGGVENVEIAMSMQSSNVAVSTNVSTNANITTEIQGISQSKPIEKWGGTGVTFPSHDRCTINFYPSDNGTVDVTRLTSRYFATSVGGQQIDLAPLIRGYIQPAGSDKAYTGWYADLGLFQHTHDISHNHSFSLRQEPHKHDIALEPHTHSASGKINLDPHSHDLNEGIKVSTKDIGTIIVNVNGTDLFTMSSSDKTKNDIDLTKNINIGQWNTISVSTNTLARIVMYGTIELITNFL